MKKLIIGLVVIMGIVMTACGSKEENKKIYVGTNAEFAPFEYLEGDKIVGFDIDLINAIAKDAGFEIEIVDMEFDGLLPSLQSKKVDLVIAGMTATEERKKAVEFSNSYYIANQVIVTKEGVEGLGNFDTLVGKKVGVILGFTGDLIVSEIEGVNVEKFDSAYAGIMALTADKVEAIVLDSEPAKNFVAKNAGLKIVEGDAESEEYAIAGRKDNKELIEKINVSLDKLKEDGTYDELLKKYF